MSAVFKCKECGIEISKDVEKIEDESLFDFILPTYRYIFGNIQDSVPEGFYTYNDEKELYRLNLEDRKTQRVDHEDITMGCCGVPWSNRNNIECKNGHKVGREVSDCNMSHSYYVDPKKITKKEKKDTNIENMEAEKLLDILENGREQDKKKSAFMLVAKNKKGELPEDEKKEVIELFEELIKDKSIEDHTKSILIKSLVEIDSTRKDILKQKLRESDSVEIRKVAALSFKEPNEEDTSQILIPKIEHEENKTVRTALEKVITENRNEETVDKLLNSLKKDIKPANKASIGNILAKIRRKDSEKISIEKIKKVIKELEKEKDKIEEDKEIRKIEYTIKELKKEIKSYHDSHLYWNDYLRLAWVLLLELPSIIRNTIKNKINKI